MLKILSSPYAIGIALIAVLAVAGLSLVDMGFAVGVGMLMALSAGTLLVLRRFGMRGKHVTVLFIVVLLLHAAAASFIYFTDFQPFSGGQGDYESYNQVAEHISYRFADGNFDVSQNIRRVSHFYPVVVASVYALLFPSMIIGQFFNVWLASLTILFLYFIIRELGGSARSGFIIGLIGSIYPSFLFYSSLLLKDVVVVLFVLLGLYLVLRMLRHFTWQVVSLLFLVSVVLTNFRFYVGIIFLGTFFVSWFLFSSLEWRKRIVYAAIMIPLFGFIPQVAAGMGYFGLKAFVEYGNEDQIAFYKEEVYSPESVAQNKDIALSQTNNDGEVFFPEPVEQSKDIALPQANNKDVVSQDSKKPVVEAEKDSEDDVETIGYASSVDLQTSFESPIAFVSTFTESFLFVAVGPFPWQFNAARHYVVLVELVPWYILLFFIGKGIIRSFKREPRALTLLIFSLGLLALLALFFSNFGITTRIRISAFLALLPFISVAFLQLKESKKGN